MLRRRLLNWIVLLFVAAAGVWTFAALLRHRHSANSMAYVADDFYYYAAVARNIHAGFGSTFDGTTPTNGYHPLYTLLLAPFTHGADLTRIFALLVVLMVCGALVTFSCARSTYARTGCGPVIANAFALLTLYLPFRMFFQGMEVTLTIPLEVAWMALVVLLFSRVRISGAAAFGAGILAALTIFSRLDSAIFIALACAALLWNAETRRRIHRGAAVAFCAACGVPLLAYVAYNRTHFGTLLPISGMAKQMRVSHGPSLLALSSIWRGVNAKLLVAMVVAAILLWLWQRRNLSAPLRALTPAAILFPIVHVLLLSVLSDWQMWGWYHYSFVPASITFLVLLATAWRSRRLAHSATAAWALLAVAVFATATNRWRVDPEMEQIAQTARTMQPFLAAHPGLYAMGDRAGMVAWLSPQPFFQTEGLVEDRAWLNTLRAQGDLVSALHARGVRYFVTTVWNGGGPEGRADATPSSAGCIRAVEPAQAGPTAPHLQSLLCGKPVAVYESGGKQTLIFDLR